MNGMSWPPGSVLKHWIDAATHCPSYLDPVDVEAQIAAAPLPWAAASNVRFERTDDRSAANILSYWDPAVHSDDPYYLAETQEPVNPSPTTQLLNRLDPNVAGGWTLRLLYLAEIHEIGHALGQVHSPAGVASIMSPVINQALTGITPYDTANVQADYGPATITLQLPDGGTLVYTPPAQWNPVTGRTYDPTTLQLPDGSQLVLQYVPPAKS